MTEQEWCRHWTILDNEVRNATEAFFIWKSVQNYAAGDEAALRAMNKNANVWNAFTHSLQTNYIITLGRIFDDDNRSYSVDKLLAEASRNPELFSIEALKRRKVEACGGVEEEWLQNYLRDAWFPTADDLEQLRAAVRPAVQNWRDIYNPIRNKMFAHRDIKVDSHGLIGKTRVADFEKILNILGDLLNAIFQIYINGRKPLLNGERYEIEKQITIETNALMVRLTWREPEPGRHGLDNFFSQRNA